MLRRISPLKHPLPLRLISYLPRHPSLILRYNRLNSTTTTPSTSDLNPPDPLATPTSPTPRLRSSFYISNVLPIRLGYWDLRPSLAKLREETLLERLHNIASPLIGHYSFRVESWEIARKDGGIFLHFSYIPPTEDEIRREREVLREEHDEEEDDGGGGLGAVSGLPEALDMKLSTSPGRLFLGGLMDSAKKQGGWPSWLGGWWAKRCESGQGVPGHTLYWPGSGVGVVREIGRGSELAADEIEDKNVGDLKEADGIEVGVVKAGMGLSGIQAAAGNSRVWVVKGRQWTEDMNRFPSSRLRVEFDGPDVSQEMLYTLFRPYGRVADITPPSPVPAGSLRYALLSFSRISPAAIAINSLHGYSTPTNTSDFTLRLLGQAQPSPITLSRLRIYYERPLKAHAVRDWISGHPRIALPIIFFLFGTLSYTFFDPIRAFFVEAKLEGVWDLEKYTLIQYLKSKASLSSLLRPSATSTSAELSGDATGKSAWSDRVEAEKSVKRWLAEYPATFITLTGPPGSGKIGLIERVLEGQNKPALVIDCAEVGKAKNDTALVSALAEQTGYYPVFSFLSSLNGMIDLASVGLIGQKAGFSTPVDQQLRQILEIVASALKHVSTHAMQHHKQDLRDEQTKIDIAAQHARRNELIARGGWHDGRLDCVAGNGVMSELGLGEEPTWEGDLLPVPPPLMDDVAPIAGEAVPPNGQSVGAMLPKPLPVKEKVHNEELDDEAQYIKTLPIVVLKNFAQKSARGDLWAVLSEWGANLVENRIAHVIVVTEGATATKALIKALPSKPLNNVALADADAANSLAYVRDKLVGATGHILTPTLGLKGEGVTGLSIDDCAQVSKLGGRMVDLETLVYKVRQGGSVKDAVDDIVLRNVVELRKMAFGDDSEDAKGLAWSRAQAWKVVSELAKHGELSYAKLLQDFPFKGAEGALKALEEHELVSVSYFEGRASMVKPGKPVFRYAFEALVNDPVFRASCQIEYNTALITKAESDIKTYETELTTLKQITSDGGESSLGTEQGGWLGLPLGKHSAIRERARGLLEKMGKSVEKVRGLESQNGEMMRLLSVDGKRS